MKKNKLGVIAIAAALTVTAGSALLLGNRLDAPQLTAGQETVKRVATWTPSSTVLTINTSNVNYKEIPVKVHHDEYKIHLTLGANNDFQFGEITRLAMSFNHRLTEYIQNVPPIPGMGPSINFRVVDSNSNRINLDLHNDSGYYVADTDTLGSIIFDSKLTLMNTAVGTGLKMIEILDTLTIEYNCIQ